MSTMHSKEPLGTKKVLTNGVNMSAQKNNLRFWRYHNPFRLRVTTFFQRLSTSHTGATRHAALVYAWSKSATHFSNKAIRTEVLVLIQTEWLRPVDFIWALESKKRLGSVRRCTAQQTQELQSIHELDSAKWWWGQCHPSVAPMDSSNIEIPTGYRTVRRTRHRNGRNKDANFENVTFPTT